MNILSKAIRDERHLRLDIAEKKKGITDLSMKPTRLSGHKSRSMEEYTEIKMRAGKGNPTSLFPPIQIFPFLCIYYKTVRGGTYFLASLLCISVNFFSSLISFLVKPNPISNFHFCSSQSSISLLLPLHSLLQWMINLFLNKNNNFFLI